MENRQFNLIPIEESLEVRSFIYQQIFDFEPFLTPTTLVSVHSKPIDIDEESELPLPKHSILMTIKENGAVIEEFGSSDNIFEAILIAKQKLYDKLVSLQNTAITKKERLAQIMSLRLSTYLN